MQRCPRLVGMDRGKRKGTAKRRIERSERGKEKAKAKEREEMRKGERQARARTTAGRETVVCGRSSGSKGGLNRFVADVHTVGSGVARKLNAISGKDDDRWN